MAVTTTEPFPSALLKSSAPRQLVAGPTYGAAAIATGSVGRHLVNESGRLENCVVNIAVAGTAGDTIARFRRLPRATGVPEVIGSPFTVANGVTDPTTVVVPMGSNGIDIEVGDIIELDVTTAPTGGTFICWTPNIARRFTM